MLAACAAEGITTIENAAREPEIEDLQNFLNCCGGKITGGGTSTVQIIGGGEFHGGMWRVMPDRIAAATYLCACACAGGDVYLLNARERELAAVTETLRRAGCLVEEDGAGIRCVRRGELQAVPAVRTAPYPGFPTDAQAVVMAALAKGRGTTVFEENMFENRYRHVDELRRLGADIRVSGRVAVVSGVERLAGAGVSATDLRGGAALCVAALGADGLSHVSEITHIDRGYEDIARDLRALGAHIIRKEE
jgi:UDP-N-acetylglucosamine 1-carboxyvinyltransferase